MDIIEITGNPIAKRRPRFFRRGKGVGTYSDQATEEGRWILELKSQIKNPDMYPRVGPIFLHIDFMMPITKSWPKYKLKQLYQGITYWHIKKPDLDNLIKWVKDCGNNILWTDDSIVCGVKASKRYSNRPRTNIQIIDV